MPILLPVGVANALNTPAAYTGLIADIPDYNDVQIGTIYIGTDNGSIQTATAGGWVALGTGGGGGNQNFDQVLTVGNLTNQEAHFQEDFNNIYINPTGIQISQNDINDVCNLSPNLILLATPGYQNYITGSSLSFTDGGTNSTIVETYSIAVSDNQNFVADMITTQIRVLHLQETCFAQLKIDVATPYCEINRPAVSRSAKYGESYIEFTDTDSAKKQYLYTNVEFNEQGVNLPANDGVIALQNPPITDIDLSLADYTIAGTKQQTYRCTGTGFNILLDAAAWENGYSVALFVVDQPFELTVTGGSALLGNKNINGSGLFYISYNQATDEFYTTNQ
jgi:hypothetical protein